ncbi:peptidase inhibitor family I36 protein [Streptomyces alkaliterrae]|uniref:Peptidase inhibitor family I36 protein n=1 Tax=Streptomyces alkaliterrae TaxID=2213162 RepID=A0A7W3ZPP1_9ACTN|nr:peptidase inhibitor family I36 protein [Streptomyces alkaliterrae]MBB1255717.1 peptidase inhibitor family I36 protein [Streptomyces alkaliterrae]MBB1257610.1 peptidase inhibitor family I36 protein [Streptomyces alkaliterrae]
MKRNILRRAVVGVSALGLAVTGLAMAPAASAAKSDCPREYVCVWNNTSFSGKPTWKSKGNLYNLKSSNGMSIVNHGKRYPGADHIWWKATWSGGATSSGCLHYPEDMPNGTTYRLYGNVTLNHAVWGGDC